MRCGNDEDDDAVVAIAVDFAQSKEQPEAYYFIIIVSIQLT